MRILVNMFGTTSLLMMKNLLKIDSSFNNNSLSMLELYAWEQPSWVGKYLVLNKIKEFKIIQK